ncbi:MAG: hypothetical protein ACKPJD_14040, partial [Planctomycetaceae bacterium]
SVAQSTNRTVERQHAGTLRSENKAGRKKGQGRRKKTAVSGRSQTPKCPHMPPHDTPLQKVYRLNWRLETGKWLFHADPRIKNQ